MYNISTFYKVGYSQPDLNFVDIKLNTDNLLFIDPRLIENSKEALIMQMQFRIESFWGELIKAVRSKNDSKISYLLSGLKEPNEARVCL
jgi:hypothetical protein